MSLFKNLKKGVNAYKKFSRYAKKINKQVDYPGRKTKTSKTYVVHDGFKYKIGKSVNPKRRISELTKNSSAYDLRIITIFPYDIERDLHKFFEDKRDKGEWFSLNKTNINFILHLSSLSIREAKKILKKNI